MPKMTDSALKAMLAAQYAGAMAASSASKLSSDRADAMAYYNGDVSKDMPAAPGRSSAVSMDVADTIDGLMPQLMETLGGSDEIAKFEPVGPDDEQAAEQETDYINHVFMNQNPGFKILHDLIKDALLEKTGIVKAWWEKEEREERETYYDKTEDEYALIVANPDVEVVEHSEHSADSSERNPEAGAGNNAGTYAGTGGPDATGPAGVPGIVPQTLHDVTVVTKKTHAQARVMGVPPEEFGIESGARDIPSCNYCYHKIVNRTEADLIKQGYDPTQIKALPSYRAWSSTEETARDTVDESTAGNNDDVNASARLVEITEHYVRMDYEGNGKPCLYRVTTGGKQGEILRLNGKPDVIEFDIIPFAAAVPFPVSHRFFGQSVADKSMDVQRVKTALLRGGLDSLYISLNPRVEVAESHASENTLDDLLVSRPNQIVRTKQPGGLNYQQSPDVTPSVYPMLSYLDDRLETRTGFSKRGQGIDSDALSNQSATASKIVENASQARVRLIARNIAEGVRDLFLLLHATIKKHGDQAQIVRLRNQWVTVDPREWKTRNDMTIHVGLGTGGRAQRLAELQLMAGLQKDALINGLTNLVNIDNLYSTAKEFTKALGMPNVDAFFTDPKTQPPPQQKPDPEMIKAQAQMQVQAQKGQLEAQKSQADTQHQLAKTQADMALAEKKFELERELKLLDAQLKLKEHEMDMQKHSVEMQRDTQKHQLDMHGQQVSTNLKIAESGQKLKEDGGVEPHPVVKEAISEITNRLDAQDKKQEELKKLITAPRKSTLHRDPKTGKASHAVHEVVQ